MADMEHQLVRYKAHLERNPDEDRLLQILIKLSRLPVSLELLQSTGIGKTVNGFRKRDGQIGTAAKTLVTNWKTLVAKQSQEKEIEKCSPKVSNEESGSEYESRRHNQSHNSSYNAREMSSKSHHRKHSHQEKAQESFEKSYASDDDDSEGDVHERRFSSDDQMANKRSRSESPENAQSEQEQEMETSDFERDNDELPDIRGSNSEDEDSGRDTYGNNNHVDKYSKKETQRHSSQTSNSRNSSKDRHNIHSEKFEKETKTTESISNKKDKTHKSHSSNREKSKHKVESNLFSPDEPVKVSKKDTPVKENKTSHSHKSSHKESSDILEKHDSKKGTKRQAESHSSQHRENSRKSAKTEKFKEPEVISEQVPDSPDEGNGLSFEDLLTYDQPLIQKVLKKKKLKSSTSVSSSNSVKQDDSKSRSKDKSHSSSESKHSHSSESKSEKRHSSDSKSEKRHSHAIDSKSEKRHSHSTDSKSEKRHSHSSDSKSEKGHSNSSKLHSKSNSDKRHSHSSSDKSKSTSHSSSGKSDSHKHSSSRKNGGKDSKGSRASGEITEENSPDSISVPTPPKQPIRLTDEDIMGYLPETQSYYKPLRFPGMDQEDSKHRANVDPMLIGSKSHSRTQVYSGRKNSGMTEMLPLFELCMRVLMDNIDGLDYVGGVPYDILKPVLEKCTAEQLYRLEDFNPQFVGETEELWLILCNRDFRGAKPDEMESWRELYLRRFDEREVKLQKLKANIAASEEARKAPVRHTKLAYVDSAAKPPRDVRRKQMKYGTATVDMTGSSSKPNPAGYQRSSLKSRLAMDTAAVVPRKAVKMVAPMMQKTMKMIKKLQRR